VECASSGAAQSLATLLILLVSGACQFNVPICGAVVAWISPPIIFADRCEFLITRGRLVGVADRPWRAKILMGWPLAPSAAAGVSTLICPGYHKGKLMRGISMRVSVRAAFPSFKSRILSLSSRIRCDYHSSTMREVAIGTNLSGRAFRKHKTEREKRLIRNDDELFSSDVGQGSCFR
jgi:hypothetical protein